MPPWASVGGVAAGLSPRLLAILRRLACALAQMDQMLQPAAAGLAGRRVGYFGFPQVMGAGYDTIDDAMHWQYSAGPAASRDIQDCRDYALLLQRHARWHVRSHAFHRRHAGSVGRLFRATFLSPSHRLHRLLWPGGHGGSVRGIPPRRRLRQCLHGALSSAATIPSFCLSSSPIPLRTLITRTSAGAGF